MSSVALYSKSAKLRLPLRFIVEKHMQVCPQQWSLQVATQGLKGNGGSHHNGSLSSQEKTKAMIKMSGAGFGR